MLHPHIRLDVNALILFNIHRNWHKRAGDDVSSALREFHDGPLLPFSACAAHGLGFVADLDDFASRALLNSQPAIERQTVFILPGDVIVHTRERVAWLLVRADRDDEFLESMRPRGWLK